MRRECRAQFRNTNRQILRSSICLGRRPTEKLNSRMNEKEKLEKRKTSLHTTVGSKSAFWTSISNLPTLTAINRNWTFVVVSHHQNTGQFLNNLAKEWVMTKIIYYGLADYQSVNPLWDVVTFPFQKWLLYFTHKILVCNFLVALNQCTFTYRHPSLGLHADLLIWIQMRTCLHIIILEMKLSLTTHLNCRFMCSMPAFIHLTYSIERINISSPSLNDNIILYL